MTDAVGSTAWGDESVRTRASGGQVYLLGAAIVSGDDVEAARRALSRLPRTGAKPHWRDDNDQRHRKAIAIVEDLPAHHVVVVAAPITKGNPERARAKCLERMFWCLEDRGVTRYVMEARTESLNKRDRELVVKLRGTKSIPQGIRYDIELPSQEPLLWLPDQVLGAVGERECGDARWVTSALDGKVERVDIGAT